ncbi:MAG: hypothetical protein KBS83_09290, partial [Lachnospiraceae bacterium]|nr:hypothetical protein [Candidatus Equihabitans merdae]
MDRENFLLKRRIKYMILLFVIFMALIISFDLIVFNSTRDTLYEDCDHQLTEAKEHVLMNPEGAIKNFLNGKQIVYHDKDLNYVISYKIFILVRNQDGAVLNADYLSAFSYMLDLKDPIEQEGRILTQRVGRNNEMRYFRTYTFSVPGTEGDVYYIQAATDVTDLQMPLSIIVRVLLFCTLGATVVMILVGWYLSKSLVSGVVEAWKQQDEFISYASHEI